MIIDEIAEVHRTPVGDAYVSEELMTWGDFGGEPSGAWIFPQISLCPDGPFAAALFCEIASEWDIAEEIDAMPRYPILRESFSHQFRKGDSVQLLVPPARLTASVFPKMTDGAWFGQAGPSRRSVSPPKEKTWKKAKAMLAKGRELVRQGKTA